MKVHKYLIIGMFVFIFEIESCKREFDRSSCYSYHNYYHLNAEAIAKVPYAGKDTLIFVSNTFDTAFCLGQGITHMYDSTAYFTNYDCPANYDYHELYAYNFRDKNNKLNITLNLEQESMSININKYYLQPIYLIYLSVNNYDDSLNISNKIWPVKKLSTSIKYNMQKGIMYYEENNIIWTLIN